MDQGREFYSNALKEFLAAQKVQIHFTTVGNHESNGMIERVHTTLTEQMRILKLQHPNENVDDLLDLALIAYNHTIHSETQKTPLELLLGHTFSRDGFDIDYEKQWYENYTNKHLEKMKLLYSNVKEKLHNRKIRRNEKINSKRKPTRKPTRAFIKTTKRVGKLKPQQEGPTEITEIDDRNIASTSSGKRVHLRQLRHPIFTSSQQQDATSSSAS
nr:unnamed protein product [Callosobruchus analis]